MKWFKRLSLLLLLLLLPTAYWAWHWVHRQAHVWVQEALEHRLWPEVQVSYQALDLDLWYRRLQLHQLQVQRTEHDSLQWSASLAHFSLEGFNLSFLWKTEPIRLSQILIDTPRLVVHSRTPDFQILRPPVEADSIPPEHQTALEIAGIVLQGGAVDFDPVGPEHLQLQFAMQLAALRWDTEMRQLQYDSALLQFTDLLYQPTDSLYRYQLAAATYHPLDSFLELAGFQQLPNLSARAFQQRFKERKSRTAVKLDSIKVHGLSLPLPDTLRLPLIELVGLHAGVYRDNRKPLPTAPKPMPQELLQQLKKPLFIDRLLLRGGRFDVQLVTRQETEPGRLFLSALSAELLGLQNIHPRQPAFQLKGAARLQGRNSLRLQAHYHYGQHHPWELSAQAGKMDLEQLNPLIGGATGLLIKSGEMQEMKFEMRGDAREGEGYVDFYYRNLHLDMLHRESRRDRWMGRLADRMGGWVYRRHNPEQTVHKRGDFEMERDVYKSFSGQWIDGLLEGMLNTLSKIDTRQAKRVKKRVQERRKRQEALK